MTASLLINYHNRHTQKCLQYVYYSSQFLIGPEINKNGPIRRVISLKGGDGHILVVIHYQHSISLSTSAIWPNKRVGLWLECPL